MRFLLFVFFILIQLNILSQNQVSNWYFGDKAGLNFSSNTLTPLLDNNKLAPAGCTSISDSDGNLLIIRMDFQYGIKIIKLWMELFN